jgi:hypothetical protein
LYGLAPIWKEPIVTCCIVVCHHLPVGIEETFDTDAANTATSEIYFYNKIEEFKAEPI